MATGPKIPSDPLELLTPDLSRPEPYINQFWGPALCGSIAFLAVGFGNWTSRRPVFSGIQKHLSFAAAAAVAGKFVDDRRRDYFAEKDAVLRHYVQLHPDDFPSPERKKFSEILEPWIPIR